MHPLELRTRRESLGLSQEALALILESQTGIPLSRSAVARWEAGNREPRDPVTLELALAALEDAFTDLVAHYIEVGESEEDLAGSGDVTFTVYASDADLAAAEPALAAAGVTAAMHRMAVGQARLELEAGGQSVRLVAG